MLGAWSGGLLKAGGSVLFLLAIAASLAHVIVCAASVARGKPVLRAARACIVLFALLAVPLAFDPKTGDVFNLTKYTVVEVAAVVLLALWAVDGASARRAPRWRIGIALPVVALVAWTAVTTALSINPRLSILGSYQSYDGLLSVAGFAILLLAAAEALDSDDLRPACSAAFYGSGGPVILYALLQFHDRYSSAHRWDWVPWGRATFGNNQIWSTFGNPNHLAGFLVIMLPLGAALILVGRAAWPKLLATAMLLAAVVELLVTGTRGAEAAVPFAVITFGLVLAPEVKQAVKRLHLPRPILAGAGAVALAGGLAFMKAAGFFHAGAGSTIQQRFELWRTAIHISLQRPLAGIGPDTFRIRFLTAQSPRYARLYGATDIANGPHNTFLNRLADQGVVGLVLFVWFLVLLGASAVGAARRLRATEIANEKNPAPARTTRFLLAGVVAGLVGFVVQATFNLEQIGLSFYLWILAGLLARVAWDAGVPGSLSLRARVAGGGGGRTPPLGEQRSSVPARRGARPTVLGAVAIVSVTLVVALSWWLSAPYRADHPYHIGTLLDAHNLHDQATGSYRHASSLNPWQPVYFQSDGQALYKTVANAPPGDQNALQALRQGLLVYRRAVALDGTNSVILDDYSESLIRLGELDPATQPSSLEAAIAVLRRAAADNRFQPRTPLLLAIGLAEAHRTPEALGVLDQGLTVTPTNPDLLRWSARLEQQQGNTAIAVGRWRDLIKIAKGDQEATQALAHLGSS